MYSPSAATLRRRDGPACRRRSYGRSSCRRRRCERSPCRRRSCGRSACLVGRSLDNLNKDTLAGKTVKQLGLIVRVRRVKDGTHLPTGRPTTHQRLRGRIEPEAIDGRRNIREQYCGRLISYQLGQDPCAAFGRDLPLAAVICVRERHLPERRATLRDSLFLVRVAQWAVGGGRRGGAEHGVLRAVLDQRGAAQGF